MKKHILLFFFGLSTLTKAQIINIPDANFKNALLHTMCVDTQGHGSYDNDADTNDDGEVQLSEALAIKRLYVPNQQIVSMAGIEWFVRLVYLNCSNNKITDLDIQPLINLEYLDCSENALKNFTAHGLNNLTDLYCGYNQLTFLSLYGLSRLLILRCEYNKLHFLELSGLYGLIELHCFGNELTTLNLRHLDRLQYINCDENRLKSLNLEGAPSLEALNCNYNQLSTLDVQHLPYLTYLSCFNNQLVYLFLKNGTVKQQGLSFEHNPGLSYICCDEIEVASIRDEVVKLGLANCTVNAYCSFTPGGIFYTLQGEAKIDADNNGCDANDPIYPSLKFDITDGQSNGSILSDSMGNYVIPLQAGTYTWTPVVENPSYYAVSPNMAQATVPASGDVVTQNFCLTVKGAHQDVEVSIVPNTPLRPGFEAIYKLLYKNKGTEAENGSLIFYFDDNLMDFVAATQNPDNQATGVLAWNYTNLRPLETRSVSLTLRCNSPAQTPPVNAGDVLTFNALVQGSQPDEMPADNDFTLQQTVVGARDPNDKTCLEGNAITPEMVGQYVHYLIRFENTGTYAAENIVVKDVIDTTVFELASLQITDASHVVKTRIGHGNEVEFIFEDIQLPFAEATNDGYVAFKIKTKPTLVLGDSLKNKAEIYFDYNLPVVTNETHTTVQNPVVKATDLGGLPLAIFPNPVRELLHFQGEAPIDRADIFDLSGKIIQSLQVSDQRVNVRALPNGPYWVKAYSSGKVYQTKMIKI